MINKFQEWCEKEREDRAEKGTSQDMCSTNGDSLFMAFIMSLVGLLLISCILFRGV